MVPGATRAGTVKDAACQSSRQCQLNLAMKVISLTVIRIAAHPFATLIPYFIQSIEVMKPTVRAAKSNTTGEDFQIHSG